MMRCLPANVVLAALALALAGCAHDREDASTSLEALAPAATNGVPSRSRPLATLPGELGRMRAIRERYFADGVRQEVTLDDGAPGLPRNILTILARTSRNATLDEAVPLEKPTEATVRAEIASAFPHVAMRVVERPSENAYGPYGLAIGRRAGDARCIFFWQWIDADRMPPDAAVPGPLSIRATLCRSGSSFDAMASALGGLRATRASDLSPDLATAAAPQAAPPKHLVRHPFVTARRDVQGIEDATIMHYQITSTPPRPGPVPDLVSDLPPEALSGPKLASRQE